MVINPLVTYTQNGDIGLITLNNPPVNALSHSLREGIEQAITHAQSDNTKILVLFCEGRTFIAGADITEFGKAPKAPILPELLITVEQSSKPIVAAIHGTALGGGFETALACHYRCALASASVGLPEVKLGLIPGAGGTQRVPRLCGVEAALEIITSGNPISAEQALSYGLIDRLIPESSPPSASDYLKQQALAYAQELLAADANPRRVRDIQIDQSSAPSSLFESYRKQLAKRARGQIAPQHVINCIEAAVHLPVDEGLKKERESFTTCLQSTQSAAMRHLFFAEREAAKIEGLPKDTPKREIKTAAVIGAGTMGGGIAMSFANVGLPVTLLEIDPTALQRGIDTIANNYRRSVQKGKLTEEEAERRQALIQPTTNYADLSNVDLVIEAVFENLAIKQDVFTQLDSQCKPGAILATNTSYQDIDAIAAATQRPEDVIGLHFFSPANVMKLLEVVRGEKTGDDVIASAMHLAKRLAKVPVLARVCHGFIGNRMLRQYGREAQLCLIEGGTPAQIDSAMESWGMAMGPLAVGDLAGLDIGYKARQALSLEQKGDPKTYCIADALVEQGRLGQKTGAGYYRYHPETRQRMDDTNVLTIIEQQAQQQGISRQPIDDELIQQRLLLALVNEGAHILAEGIAQRSSDIDVVYVFGYGFPASRGGPMHYADSLGLDKVHQILCKFSEQYGEKYWAPAPLLTQLANEGSTFAEWSKTKR